MIYMVEMDLNTPGKRDEWDSWYENHIALLMSIPGFRFAQRFRSVKPDDRSYLAIYSLDSGDVLTSDTYRTRAGPKSLDPWLAHVSNWRRNLFSGLSEMPEVGTQERLLVTDGDSADRLAGEIGGENIRDLGVLESIGLAKSTPFRRLAILPADFVTSTAPASQRIYEAISERRISRPAVA